MRALNYLLEQTAVYSVWQAPFAKAKLAPLLANDAIPRARRVLDVGCGPGTNTHLFAHADYLGIDINPAYISYARRKHNRPFIAADVISYEENPVIPYDFILVNSFLHHLESNACSKILQRLQAWLSEDGYIHLLELVLPKGASFALFMAHADRGEFPRPIAEWRDLFEKCLDIVQFEPYPLGPFGLTFWSMVYCRGKRKT